jgi:long-subunit acyl-CoA synthetase (AMP-forming)
VLLDGYPVACEVRLERSFGELQVRTASLGHFAGRSQRLDAAGWFRSSDLARRAPDGRMEITGRSGASP